MNNWKLSGLFPGQYVYEVIKFNIFMVSETRSVQLAPYHGFPQPQIMSVDGNSASEPSSN